MCLAWRRSLFWRNLQMKTFDCSNIHSQFSPPPQAIKYSSSTAWFRWKLRFEKWSESQWLTIIHQQITFYEADVFFRKYQLLNVVPIDIKQNKIEPFSLILSTNKKRGRRMELLKKSAIVHPLVAHDWNGENRATHARVSRERPSKREGKDISFVFISAAVIWYRTNAGC